MIRKVNILGQCIAWMGMFSFRTVSFKVKENCARNYGAILFTNLLIKWCLQSKLLWCSLENILIFYTFHIFTCKKNDISVQFLSIILNYECLGSKRGCFSSYDPFSLNGIHERQELRKCPALEYSITNLLRKDKDYLEIWKLLLSLFTCTHGRNLALLRAPRSNLTEYS